MELELSIRFSNTVAAGAAAGAIGLFAAIYPGGEITVKYFPSGYVEVQSALILDEHSFDPHPGMAQPFQAEDITIPTSAAVAFVFS